MTYIDRKYIKHKANNESCKVLVAMNIASSPTDETSDDITALDASEFIEAQYNNCELNIPTKITETPNV